VVTSSQDGKSHALHQALKVLYVHEVDPNRASAQARRFDAHWGGKSIGQKLFKALMVA
jgi:hypothetical protein